MKPILTKTGSLPNLPWQERRQTVLHRYGATRKIPLSPGIPSLVWHAFSTAQSFRMKVLLSACSGESR